MLQTTSRQLTRSSNRPRRHRKRNSLIKRITQLPATVDTNNVAEREKQINKSLALASTALTMTVVGNVAFPALTVLSLVPLSAVVVNYVRRALTVEIENERYAVAALDTLFGIGPLLLGNIFASAAFFTIDFTGRKLLLKTEDNSRKSLVDVYGNIGQHVWVEIDGVQTNIPFESVKAGDIVIVVAGEPVPVDGVIVRGQAAIDQCVLTGESQLIEKGVGDSVLASTMVLEGEIGVSVQQAGEDTVAAQVGTILNQTADYKSQVVARSEKIIGRAALPTLMLGALSVPLLGLESGFTMLYAGFGYQLRTAGPLSVLGSLRMANEKGILVKDGRALELLHGVDTFVFDKTGTLTTDVPTVGEIHVVGRFSAEKLLHIAAAAETRQTHPIALAICQAAQTDVLPLTRGTKVEVGYGIQATVCIDNRWQTVRLGSERYMTEMGIGISDHVQAIQKRCHDNGYMLVYVAVENKLCGAIELHPTIRPEAQSLIHDLQARGKSVYIISGDHERPTRKLAQTLGIENYFAEVLPQDKAHHITQLQEAGHSVCFVGDGINDSIALKTAQVGVSMRGASTVATDTASVVFMGETIQPLITLLDIADSLDNNLSRGQALTYAAGAICVGSIVFLNMGIMGGILVYNASLAGALLNASWPWIKHRQLSNSRGNLPVIATNYVQTDEPSRTLSASTVSA